MDYAGSTPVDPRVKEAMEPYFSEVYGNPSSLHSAGREAAEALSKAREQVAGLVNAKAPRNIIFTSGATEATNLAIKGVAARSKDKKEILISAIEHISVVNVCRYLQKQGFTIRTVPVDSYGLLDLEALKEALSEKTALISVMYANNEIGTIEPVREIGGIARDAGVPFHCDATAACGKVPIDVEKERIDLLTISSNDMYGPKGTGALYVRDGIRLEPLIHGGGQERGLRSGTENLPNIAGMGAAAELAGAEMEREGKRLTGLRDTLIKGVLDSIPESYLNGHPKKRLPNNAHFRFSYIEGESIILSLDMIGVQAASGSACTSKTLEPSKCLTAIGLSHEEAHGSLQLTLGRSNTMEDVKYVVDNLPGIIKRLRAMSPLAPKMES
ncbi:MAG: cysteine desulfurase [Methanobacteriota archaeon]|nr:MAG: cysteine desulfurase [Euryarchaeota archaeon]